MFRLLRFALPFAAFSVLCSAQSSSPPADAKAPAPQAASPSKLVETSAGPSSTAAATTVPSVENPLAQAKVLYSRGDFTGAITKFEQFLELHPQSPDGYAGLVHAYLKLRDVELAAQMADKGMAQSDSPRMRSARAEVWFRQGKIPEAEKEWIEIVKSGYPEARAYLGLARIRDAIAMYKTAKVLIDKAHAIDPYDTDIQEQWMSSLSRADRIHYMQGSRAENSSEVQLSEREKGYLNLSDRAGKTAKTILPHGQQGNGHRDAFGSASVRSNPSARLWIDGSPEWSQE